MGCAPSKKTNRKYQEWPELVGTSGEYAMAQIRNQHPNIEIVEVIRPGAIVNLDYRLDRVRIHVDDQGNVIKSPSTG